MTERRDIVDIAGLTSANDNAGNDGLSLRGRPWLAVMFKCCQAYSRIYRNREGTAYQGRCPRCQRPLRVGVGPGGTSNRFFEAE